MAKALSRIGMDDGKSLEYLQSINMVPEVTDPYGYMEKQGMMVTRLTPEQMQNFYKATQKFVTNGPKIGPDLVKAAQDDMASAKKIISLDFAQAGQCEQTCLLPGLRNLNFERISIFSCNFPR